MYKIYFFILIFLSISGIKSGFSQSIEKINIYQKEYFDWPTNHLTKVLLPPLEEKHEKILLKYTLSCPTGGCNPWDQTSVIKVLKPTGVWDSTFVRIDTLNTSPLLTDSVFSVYEVTEPFEICRLITPYGSGFSQTWKHTWEMDVTDYKPLLHDSTRFSAYIETWGAAWHLTLDLEFTKGIPDREAFEIVPIYLVDPEYGNPSNPISAAVPQKNLEIPEGTKSMRLRTLLTGHGQGNTFNAAEFIQKTHKVHLGDEVYEHYLWRDDCERNPVSPQSGTWQFDRAGWCPGDIVSPFLNDVPYSVIEGKNQLPIKYEFESYTNLCGPHNSNCVSGQTCQDCNYNYTGHTMPYYRLSLYAIFYKSPFEKDVAITAITSPNSRHCSSSINPIIEFKNTGNLEVNNAVINVFLDNTKIWTKEYSGSLAAGASTSIELDGTNIVFGNHTLRAEITVPGDENPENNSFEKTFEYINGTHVTLELMTDGYGEETSFVLMTNTRQVLETGGGFSSNSQYTFTYCLADGCYRLRMKDSEGDGMCCSQGNGYYRLKDRNGDILVEGNTFLYEEEKTFCLDKSVLALNDDTEDTWSVYPNPTNGSVHIRTSSTKAPLAIQLFDAMGRMYTVNAVYSEQGTYEISLKQFPTGMYLLRIVNSENKVYQEKLILTR